MAVNRTQSSGIVTSTGGLTLIGDKNRNNPITFAPVGNFLLSPNFKPAQASITFAMAGALVGRTMFDPLFSDITKVALSNAFLLPDTYLTVTAVNTGGANTSARSNAFSSAAFPKLYCSATADIVTGTVGIGICNASQANTTGLSASLNAVGYFANGTVVSNSVTLSTIQTFVTGDVIDMAVDFTNNRIWFRTNGGNWNNSGTANPATNTGGIDISSLNAGPYYVAVEVDNTGDKVTINFDGSFLPYADGVVPVFYADFAQQSYWYNNNVYATFALWLTAVGGVFTRSTTATYTNSAGLIATAAIDAARFDYNPVTLAPKGILLEGTGTNSVWPSINWSYNIGPNATVTNNYASVTAPDGTTTGMRFQWTITGNSFAVPNPFTSTAGTIYTGSIYIHDNGGSGDFALFVGAESTAAFVGVTYDHTNHTIVVFSGGPVTNISGTITAVGNGWYRLTGTGTFTNAYGPGYPSFAAWAVAASDNGDYTVWGVQCEQAAFASSYIPTSTAAVARTADFLTATALTALLSGTGSVYAKTTSVLNNNVLGEPGRIFGDSLGANTVLSPGSSTAIIMWNSAVELDGATNNATWTTVVRGASSYDGSGRSITSNGAAPGTDANTQGALTGIGKLGGGQNNPENLYGNIMQAAAWNVRISNAALQNLTTP